MAGMPRLELYLSANSECLAITSKYLYIVPIPSELDATMREIAITTDVFAAIWAARLKGENSESEILERILGVVGPNKKLGEASNPRIRWVDDIITALNELGGSGYYSDIYKKVREIRLANARSAPRSFAEVVRKEIEIHSSESEAFQHREDLFTAPKGLGAGFWALKNLPPSPET
ncbi:putative CopG family antitoxin [Phyllobacterium ifriqiyense]|uniref:CopG family antitoxin n=1 Tax=Phyllobacterium ifriqiyense TaxID=314238 RepID=A0ABU0SAG3_9HYPH|nr:hypothetical protein [Phyllobacterium ifriqiyense]MDQ0997760.1 putative CopG family antitoxin [Phyllobacterium ifriqiyense]